VKRRSSLPFFAVPLLALLLLALPASAQQIETYASVDSVTVGDRFELTLVLGHDGSGEAIFPHDLLPDSLQSAAIFTLGDFEILRMVSRGGRDFDLGGRIDSVVYEATTFALDTARVAGIPVGLVAQGDTLVGAAPAFFLQIGSLVPEDAEDIKDLADLAEFDRAWWPWVVGILALLAVAYGLWWWRRKNGMAEEIDIPEPEPQIPPYQQALERLVHLQTIDLSDSENIKPFYIELTDILRTYVGRRAHVPALESTTRELLNRLKGSSRGAILPNEVVLEIDDVLTHADLVKFADLKPILEQTRAMVAETRDAIEGTESIYKEDDARLAREAREAREALVYAPPGENEDEELEDVVENVEREI